MLTTAHGLFYSKTDQGFERASPRENLGAVCICMSRVLHYNAAVTVLLTRPICKPYKSPNKIRIGL